MKKNRFSFSDFDKVFGELQDVYRVGRGTAEIIFIPGVLFFLFLFGIITYVGSEDILAIPFCVIIPFLLFCGIVWQIFSTRKDELKIYKNGFTYLSGKKLHACLWQEIESFAYNDSNPRHDEEIREESFPLASVTKKGGEVIDFTDGLRGTTEIVKRFEAGRK